jgi:hypothetical protein
VVGLELSASIQDWAWRLVSANDGPRDVLHWRCSNMRVPIQPYGIATPQIYRSGELLDVCNLTGGVSVDVISISHSLGFIPIYLSSSLPPTPPLTTSFPSSTIVFHHSLALIITCKSPRHPTPPSTSVSQSTSLQTITCKKFGGGQSLSALVLRACP